MGSTQAQAIRQLLEEALKDPAVLSLFLREARRVQAEREGMILSTPRSVSEKDRGAAGGA